MLKPRAVRPGDRLALVAPASPFERKAFDAGVVELRTLGFEPVYDDDVFARREFVAGEPTLRAETLRIMGREMATPRLTSWHGDPGAAYHYSGRTFAPNPWTPDLAVLRDRLNLALGASEVASRLAAQKAKIIAETDILVLGGDDGDDSALD